ncbi:MAG: RNA polymerase subunit sigma-24 [Chloroflexi bacterium HGW-Chloroflexi-2]|nr:MAG: RNA polymerase subunit sigma-24 [Chloroflexi bacterium HGW-Chloroflexi-2]
MIIILGFNYLAPLKVLPLSEQLDDIQLIEDACNGDNEAFGLLYERNVRKIYNYIYYRTGNINEAEDLTSKVFQRAFRHIESYNQRGVPFSAWLYRIAHNLVANWYRDRSRKKEVALDDQLPSSFYFDFPESSLEKSEESEKMMKAIRRLPPERQQLIILKFVEGLSNSEIGLIMQKSEGAIKSLYHRTLESLRKEIEKIDQPKKSIGKNT